MSIFADLYNEAYKNIYCAYKEDMVIDEEPIPYIIDNNLKIPAKYENDKVFFQTDRVLNKHTTVSTIYHELTHYYDEKMFKKSGYSSDEIAILGITFSEIHASYNGMLSFLGYKNLIVDKKIKSSKKVNNNQTLAQFIAINVAQRIAKMNNTLGVKEAMYLLGEKRALYKVVINPLDINKVFSYKSIPEIIRSEIMNIDKLINISSYDNIEVNQININILQAENKLTENSLKRLALEMPMDIQEDIHNILGF